MDGQLDLGHTARRLGLDPHATWALMLPYVDRLQPTVGPHGGLLFAREQRRALALILRGRRQGASEDAIRAALSRRFPAAPPPPAA